MFHHDRTWCVTPVESAKELARKLTTIVWTCCTAFELGGYLWLNDSTSPDVPSSPSLNARRRMVRCCRLSPSHSGWCNQQQSLEYVQQTLRGEFDASEFAHEVHARLQTPQEHGRCHHCA